MDNKNLLPPANACIISTTTTKEKRNLVFMSNFYHKVAVASVGIALGFALGTHKEAKAATFTFTETSRYHLRDPGDLPDLGNTSESLAVGIKEPQYNTKEDYRAFYEFNIAMLLGDPNIVITRATLQADISHIRWYRLQSQLEVYGYTENEKVDPLGVYNIGEYLDQISINFLLETDPNLHASSAQLPVPALKGQLSLSNIKGVATFNVLPFINNRIGSNNSFAGFGIRLFNGEGYVTLDPRAYLTITTAKVAKPVSNPTIPVANERVPEPTTIFGSAIGLCLGGWLKRRKSALQKKTTS